MTVDAFVRAYQNGVDYDGAYGKQCVDYVNAYALEVLGVKNAFVGPQYAYQIYTQFNSYPRMYENFTRVANGASNYPSKGDVLVWAKERNGYAGHIALVLGATAHTITVSEQNYDGKGGVREYTYPNYNYVLGWLVPKDTKRNKPAIKAGQTVKLRCRAVLYSDCSAASKARKISDFSKFDCAEKAVIKAGANLKCDKVMTKSNGNLWVYNEQYGGWACLYEYKNDVSKVSDK